MKLEIRNLKFEIVAVALLLLTSCERPTLPPGGFAAKATLSEETLLVGDVVTLTLTAHHAPGSTVQFPIIGNSKEVVVRGRSIDTTELTEDILETEEIVQLTSLRIGEWRISTNSVVCAFADGTEKAQALPELTIQVQSSLNATNETSLSDIKGLIKPPLQISRFLWVFTLIILIALTTGLITLLLRKSAKALLASEPVILPHIKARTALASLKECPWVPEPFFVDLSLILRTYLEDRFELNAPESTTEELARKLNHDPRLNLKDQNTLREFFVQADLVKFARAGAEKDVMRTAFSTVETFVEQTGQDQCLPQESTKNSKTEVE